MRDMEIELLLQSIKEKYGYDFTEYKQASLQRRLSLFLETSGKQHFSELIPLLLHDNEMFRQLLNTLTINITEMFRDPAIYRYVCEKIIPVLASFPRINIWSAGCSTGQEAYSLGILLMEAGLKNRSHIFGTDINERIVNLAREGIYFDTDFENYSKNYLNSGGTQSLDNYVQFKYGKGIISTRVKENISFFNHNLATDGSFIEAQLIVCSNVLIYFNPNLQKKVWELFYHSLHNFGYLVLGIKEKIPETMLGKMFQKVSPQLPVYRKIPHG